MNGSMERCRKLERDRERMVRKSRQGAFEASMISLDACMAATPEPAWLSDGGRGAEAVYAAVEDGTRESVYARRLKAARERLRRAHPELLEVFDLIVRNGSNRRESIWQLMRN